MEQLVAGALVEMWASFYWKRHSCSKRKAAANNNKQTIIPPPQSLPVVFIDFFPQHILRGMDGRSICYQQAVRTDGCEVCYCTSRSFMLFTTPVTGDTPNLWHSLEIAKCKNIYQMVLRGMDRGAMI